MSIQGDQRHPPPMSLSGTRAAAAFALDRARAVPARRSAGNVAARSVSPKKLNGFGDVRRDRHVAAQFAAEMHFET